MKALCLITWMILTLILALSIIGLLLLINQTVHYSEGKPDIHKSTWMQIGEKLLDSVINEKAK